jgi:UDP-glucose 4-epimerase
MSMRVLVTGGASFTGSITVEQLIAAGEQGHRDAVHPRAEFVLGDLVDASFIDPGSPYDESKYILEHMLYWLDRTVEMRYAALF